MFEVPLKYFLGSSYKVILRAQYWIITTAWLILKQDVEKLQKLSVEWDGLQSFIYSSIDHVHKDTHTMVFSRDIDLCLIDLVVLGIKDMVVFAKDTDVVGEHHERHEHVEN
jgi:hypothetical protein